MRMDMESDDRSIDRYTDGGRFNSRLSTLSLRPLVAGSSSHPSVPGQSGPPTSSSSTVLAT